MNEEKITNYLEKHGDIIDIGLGISVEVSLCKKYAEFRYHRKSFKSDSLGRLYFTDNGFKLETAVKNRKHDPATCEKLIAAAMQKMHII